MQKTFKNQHGREFLLLDLPSDFKYIAGIVRDHFYYWTDTCRRSMDDYPYSLLLPSDNYQILCLSKDATEEQAKQIIDDDFFDGYHDYQNNNKKGLCDTAKESLTSLLTSLAFKQDDNVLILEKI